MLRRASFIGEDAKSLTLGVLPILYAGMRAFVILACGVRKITRRSVVFRQFYGTHVRAAVPSGLNILITCF